jgi:serine/threonine-protein kinase
MPLEPGTTLGPYQVTAKIGEGGMGEVYRARDTKLDRDVALKVLPEAFTSDPDRLARFEREAKVLASLNHPNIGHIYGLEEAEGTRALVLELIEGPTLADRIAQGPIPIDEALPIAKQIAEALEAAHEAGVIHRDLKPANIKVREDGTVKVLDFGLAKALDTTPEGDPSLSPTLTAAATQMGVIMGTAAYMSPEQAAGKTADKRSDIWSFGVVLFEMLTGEGVFVGETVSHVLGAVLQVEPTWKALPTATPQVLRKLLRRCLEKERKNRLRDIGDALAELDEALAAKRTESGGISASSEQRRRSALLPAVAASAVAVAVTALVIWNLTSSVTPEVTRFTVSLPSTDRPVVSPDGRLVAADTEQGVFIRRLDELEAVPLRGAECCRLHGFSPDSGWVLFSVGSSLRRVPVTGGAVITIGEFPGGIVDWGPADRLVGEGPGRLWIESAVGEALAPLAPASNSRDDAVLMPRLLPNGRAVLFHRLREAQEGDDEWVVGLYDMEMDQEQILFPGSSPQFAASGHLVFWREGSLWAVPFDPETYETPGVPRLVVDAVLMNNRFGVASFSLSDVGTLVYLSDESGDQWTLEWVDRAGISETVGMEPGRYAGVRLSPSGRWVAVEDEGSQDLWLYDLARKTLTRFTNHEALDAFPVWTPDSDRIVFASSRGGGQLNLFSKRVDGTGEVERVTTAEELQVPASISPDGKTVVLVRQTLDTGYDVGIVAMDGEPAVQWMLAESFGETYPEVSPDGRWMAYASRESGRDEIYVRPFPNTEARRWIISRDGGTTPAWSPGGRELFYRGLNGEMMVVRVETETTFSPGNPEQLFEGDDFRVGGSPGGRAYDIDPTGDRFLMVRTGTGAGMSEAVVVLNWTEELTRLVPTP